MKLIKSARTEAFQKYSDEADIRSTQFAAGQYFKRRNILVVVAIVILGLATIYELITPPPSIVKTIESNPRDYLLFRSGHLSFDQDINSKSTSPQNRNLISLPFRDVQKLTGYSPANIHYTFSVQVPESKFQAATLGLLIPRIWGVSKVYVNGQLSDFGENAWPLLPLLSASSEIDIFVDATKSAIGSPISATYPLVVAEKKKLHQLVQIVEDQSQASPRALAVYSLAIVIFGMLFLAYPRKPELLAFIFFLGASLCNSLVFQQYSQRNVLFVGNWNLQQAALLSLDLLVSCSLLSFTLFFFRAHPKYVWARILDSVLYFATIGLALSYFLFKALDATRFTQIGHVVLNSMFLGFHLAYVLPRFIYLVQAQNIPIARKIAGGMIILAALAICSVTVIEYFNLLTSVTSIYKNGLLLNLVISVVVAYEISRAEVNQQILGSMLPKEVREGLHLNKKGVDQRGFVLLVDAIGYAASRERFDDVDERTQYVARLAAKMLAPVNDLKIENFSILNCTGDGLYCAIRGEANSENFSKVLELAMRITVRDERESEEQILFRAAIGYGNYGVRIIEHGNIRKEFVAGNILNDLSRVIGSQPGKTSLRILLNTETRSLLHEKPVSCVKDKHGFEHFFTEISETKKAA